MATEAQTCALVAIKNRLPHEIAKRYLTGADLLASTTVESPLQISSFYAKQSQFPG